MDHHPHASWLTPGVTFEDLDVSDDVWAPFRVAIDRGEQGKAILERCGDLRCGLSMKCSCPQRLPDGQMPTRSARSAAVRGATCPLYSMSNGVGAGTGAE